MKYSNMCSQSNISIYLAGLPQVATKWLKYVTEHFINCLYVLQFR